MLYYTKIVPAGTRKGVFMSYHIDLGQWNQIFAVPTSVVDRHMKLASEAQLKVLLYLLRHAGDQKDDADIADALGVSSDEVRNAVAFWCERGLIRQDGGELSPQQNHARSDISAPEVPKEDVKKNHTAISRAVRPDSAFVSRLLKEDTILAGLMEEAQSVLRKPLSPGDTATLVMLYDTFGLPCEVIAMLLHYLADSGSANMRAVERLGIAWSDNGVNSAEAAEREIERMASSREAWGRVCALLGLHNAGRPTQAQLASAERWVNTWRFNDEMIAEAYDRCVNTKGAYNMSYINAILKKWYEKRIFSLDALRAFEERPAAAKTPKQQNRKGSVFSADGASFDLTKYEKQSLFDD